MWQKVKEFSRKDPFIFTILLAVILVGGGYGFVMQMHMTSTAKFCKTCHPKEHVGVRGEYYSWTKGIHSEVGVSCLDCHGAPGIKGYMNAHVVAGMKSLYHEIFTPEEEVVKHLTAYASDPELAEHAAPTESCIFCHTDEGNQEMRRNRVIKIAGEFRMMDEVKNPEYRTEYGRPDIMTEGVSAGVEPNHAAHMEAGLNCYDCHLGVGHAGERFHKPEMETCFNCHDDVRQAEKVPANDDCASCHTLQKGMQKGDYAKGVEGYEWYMADLDCADCHDTAFSTPNVNKCISCHDESYAEIMVDTQKTFSANLEKAQDIRDRLLEQREDMPHGKKALVNELHYLVRIMTNDGSKGIHNPEYFESVYYKVLDLEKAVQAWTPPVEKEDAHAVPAVHIEEEEEVHAEEPAGPVNSEELMSILEGLEVIDLGERYAPEGKKPAVMFEHKMHAEKLECTNCHADPESGMLKIEVPEVVKGTNNVFHKELCITCHKEKRVKKSCNTCHKK
jgi:nitrate/TMAO reductase-like tetraheme cytochrome c subunit